MITEKCNAIVYDNILEITTKNGFEDNCKYKIYLKGIKDKQGNVFDKVITFCTKLSPLYSDILSVRSLIGNIEIPDETILYQIRQASKYADYIYDSEGEPFTEDNVPFEVNEFVKYRAAYESLLLYSIKETSAVGTSGTVGEVSFSDKETNRDVKNLLSALQDEISKWRDAVKGYGNEGRAKPTSAIKGKRQSYFYSPGYVSPKIDDFNRSIQSGGRNDVLR